MRKLYFYDTWNRFDFVVVVLSILFLLLKSYASINLGMAMTGVRAFRFVKLLQGSPKLKTLWLIVKTFMVALQPLLSVGCMLLLVLYIYAISGVEIFAQVMWNDTITDTLNFETFPKAALALFVVLTADGWPEILKGAV